MALGPFDLAGGPFLALYLVLLVAAIIAGELVPRWLRPAGHRQAVADADRLAILAGGRARFADAVVVRLLAAGALRLAGGGFVIEPRARAESAAELSVLRMPQPLRWRRIVERLAPHAAGVEAGLVGAGLRVDDRAAFELRLCQILPYLLLLVFGAMKLLLGVMRDRPVGFLALLLVVTAGLAAARWLRVDRLTAAGQAALAEARARRERLARGPVVDELGEAVALFGTMVLAGSAWGDFHRLRTAGSGDGGSADGSSGDGGSGDGGGGGCGGCS